MSSNPYVIFACGNCHDMRVRGTPHGDPENCAVCGYQTFKTRYEYEEWYFRRKDTLEEPARNENGELMCEVDLTADEFAIFREWGRRFPHVSKNRRFKWIEGRRYDPSKDPSFLEELACRQGS